MPKRKANKKRTAGSIILFALGTGVLTVLIPIVLAVILGVWFPTLDTYLLTGFVFLLFVSIAIIIIPTVLLLVISSKRKQKGVIKKFCKDYKLIVLSLIVIEIGFVSGGYTYFKDLKTGPQEAIMTDVVVERRSTGKSSGETYLIGYIDGEKTKLNLTRDARDAVCCGESYESLKVRYYENIAEVFEIDVD